MYSFAKFLTDRIFSLYIYIYIYNHSSPRKETKPGPTHSARTSACRTSAARGGVLVQLLSSVIRGVFGKMVVASPAQHLGRGQPEAG
jgi:hypothetical protein